MNNNRKKELHRINNRIKSPEVRLVGDNITTGVYSIQEAIKIADDIGLDLVEISPNAEPPVVKVIDYKKFLYDQKKSKRDREKKQRQNRVETKELRFGPNTDTHDFEFKLKHAEKFLKEGNRVKAYVFFKGREITFKDKGEILLLKFAQALEEIGVVESMPKLEGKRMNMFIKPKK